MRKLLVLATLAAMAVLPVTAHGVDSAAVRAVSDASTWDVDAAHTEINFSVTHFFTPVTGSFDVYEIDLQFDAENPENSTVEARVAVASVNTGNEKRDAHLRSADWFDADEYPYISFKSTAIKHVGGNQYLASGILKIKDQTRQVDLPITLLGIQPIPDQMREMLGGVSRIASFKAETAIDRGDFGVGVGNWAATMIVGGDVNIQLLVEANTK